MIAIVTDSTSYFTAKEAADLGIHMIPISYIISGRQYQEGFSDQNGRYEELLAECMGQCTTSQTPITVFMNAFSELMQDYDEVLCIVISSRLSGNHSSASIAAREVNPEKVKVVDSLSTAGGLAMLVKKAKALADQGLTLADIKDCLERDRYKVGVAFSVDSMDALRRSGRLGIVRQSVGTILNIRPILLCQNGAVVSHGFARGRAEQIKVLVKEIPANAKNVIVHYLGEKVGLESMLTAVKQRFSQLDVRVSRLGPVLGIHLGLGVIAVAWEQD